MKVKATVLNVGRAEIITGRGTSLPRKRLSWSELGRKNRKIRGEIILRCRIYCKPPKTKIVNYPSKWPCLGWVGCGFAPYTVKNQIFFSKKTILNLDCSTARLITLSDSETSWEQLTRAGFCQLVDFVPLVRKKCLRAIWMKMWRQKIPNSEQVRHRAPQHISPTWRPIGL